uniref:Uncharacterized protein n=1 Tax=Oryza sativa subsp. indica TaxID=39946 RepID=C5NNU5_ORYSI|nr:hypothetical protein [Oryza sativa Indica Group]
MERSLIAEEEDNDMDGKPLGLAKRSLEEQIMLQYAKDALQSPDGSWHVVINKEG